MESLAWQCYCAFGGFRSEIAMKQQETDSGHELRHFSSICLSCCSVLTLSRRMGGGSEATSGPIRRRSPGSISRAPAGRRFSRAALAPPDRRSEQTPGRSFCTLEHAPSSAHRLAQSAPQRGRQAASRRLRHLTTLRLARRRSRSTASPCRTSIFVRGLASLSGARALCDIGASEAPLVRR